MAAQDLAESRVAGKANIAQRGVLVGDEVTIVLDVSAVRVQE